MLSGVGGLGQNAAVVDVVSARRSHGRLAARVAGCFAESFRLAGTDVMVGTSVGVAVQDDAGERTAEQPLRKAGTALYRHKQHGRGARTTR